MTAALENHKKEWDTTLNAISDWICLLDMNAGILRSNRAVESFLGVTAKEVIGKNCCQLIHGKKDPIANCPVQKSLKTRQRESIEFIIPDNRCIMVTADPVFDQHGDIEYFVHIIRDVSELKNLEIQLLQANKREAIGTLAGGIAHEFNNILSIILGNCELALDNTPGDSPTLPLLDEIKTAGFRAKDVVKHLLRFSFKQEEKLNPMSFEVAIKSSIKLFELSVDSHIQVASYYNCHNDRILGNPSQLHHIIINLGQNAIHAMGKLGGCLAFSVYNFLLTEETDCISGKLAPGEYVKLSVQDTGEGIPPDIVDKIFDPYYTTKAFGEGIGMGLTVVQGIVKSHGGAIQVESKPGTGSIFSILLPTIKENG